MNIGGIFCRKYSDSACIEKRGVLFQFVCHLINDETAAGRERIYASLQECPFFIDLQNAEWNA